jgi:predicted amidohydrolase YtcJ
MRRVTRWRWFVLAFLAPVWHAAAAGDLLLLHGHIYTAKPQAPWAQALAIHDTRIVAVGTDTQILRLRRATSKSIDLRGQTVIPGIVDSHMHLLYGAYALHGLNLSTPQESITPAQPQALIARLQAYAAAHPADAVLFARADFSTAPPTTPSAALLNRAVPDRPLVVHNTSEHALGLNSAALRLAGFDDRPVANADEERGVVRDASGHPTGVLLEAAMQVVARAVAPRIPLDEQLRWVRDATHFLNSFGITSVVNASGDLAEIRLYASLRDRGELTVRTRTAFGAVAVPHRLTPAFLAELDQARRLYHDEWVAANLVKFFADGSTGLVPPLVYEPHDYAAMIAELDGLGYQVMTHALRDDSVHMVLDAYERLEQTAGVRDRRLRIEHADLIDAPDLPRFARLNVIADMQPTFCCAEVASNFGDSDPLVSDRWESLRQSGATLAFSSDWPCTWPPDPFVAMQEATTRQVWSSAATADIAGEPLDGAAQAAAHTTGASYAAQERLAVQAAVDAYTRGSAYAAFADTDVGTLEVGKLADLAVLSQDIFAVAPDTIAATHVRQTWVGGKIVYTAKE